MAARPTTDPLAYDHYLRGTDALRSARGPEDYRVAVGSFQRAVAADPSFALAYAGLSESHTRIYWAGIDPAGRHRARAREAVDRALALDPELPEAHFALGLYHYHGFLDYDRALEAFESALRRAPNRADFHFVAGRALHQAGEIERGIASRERAVQLDPQAPRYAEDLAWAYTLVGRYDEAHRLYDRVLNHAPELASPYETKARSFQLQGELGKAAGILRRGIDSVGLLPILNQLGDPWNAILLDSAAQDAVDRLPLGPGVWDTATFYLRKAFINWKRARAGRATVLFDSAAHFGRARVRSQPDDYWLRTNLALALAGTGRRDEAIAEALRAVDLLPTSRDRRWGPDMVWALGNVYMMLGEHETAIQNFERAVAASLHPSAYRRYFRHHPIFETLQDHPRFRALVADDRSSNG